MNPGIIPVLRVRSIRLLYLATLASWRFKIFFAYGGAQRLLCNNSYTT